MLFENLCVYLVIALAYIFSISLVIVVFSQMYKLLKDTLFEMNALGVFLLKRVFFVIHNSQVHYDGVYILWGKNNKNDIMLIRVSGGLGRNKTVIDLLTGCELDTVFVKPGNYCLLSDYYSMRIIKE